MKTLFANFALVIFSILLITLGVEASYRMWVYHSLKTLNEPVTFDPSPSLGVYNPAPWQYDKEAGFSYIPNQKFLTAQINNGRFHGCSPESSIANARGNIGDIIGEWEDGEVKILILGDSFTSMNFDGDTWPNLFQRKLEDTIGKKVRIANFGRDAYGIVQMLDLAAREVERWKPDYIIFAFITDDFLRPRHWRSIQKVDEYWRFFMSLSPDPKVDIANTFTNEVAFVNPQVTSEWCDMLTKKIANGDKDAALNDDLVKALIQQYNVIRQQNQRSVVDLNDVNFWTLKHSYFYNRMIKGNTFEGTKVRPKKVGFYRMDIDDYADDPQFRASLNRILNSKAKTALVHLPVSKEIESNQEYRWADASIEKASGESLVASLEREFGLPIINLVPIIRREHDDFHGLRVSETDQHPNAEGIRVYAKAIKDALVEKNFFDLPIQ